MNRLTLSLASAIALLAAAPAFAGECPAGNVQPHAAQSGPTEPKGVTDTVLSEIDLTAQYGVAGRNFRMRRLEVAPGGIVPMHSHAERPAHIYVVKGEITEHRSTCSTPILHKAGDVAAEGGDLSHWWRNDSRRPVTLISADILPPAMPASESM